jgi:cytoskeletal protein CcmA (bactofilin family)
MWRTPCFHDSKEELVAPIDPPTLEQTEERVTTVIAEDVHIKGSLESRTPLMIKGPLEGEIISEGLLVVGPTGKINATIVTERLISRGEITGDVTASEQVVLREASIQTGNITTPYLIVERGAILNGSCVMKRKAVAGSPQNETGEEGSSGPDRP